VKKSLKEEISVAVRRGQPTFEELDEVTELVEVDASVVSSFDFCDIEDLNRDTVFCKTEESECFDKEKPLGLEVEVTGEVTGEDSLKYGLAIELTISDNVAS
jgi:hypothetical protein